VITCVSKLEETISSAGFKYDCNINSSVLNYGIITITAMPVVRQNSQHVDWCMESEKIKFLHFKVGTTNY